MIVIELYFAILYALSTTSLTIIKSSDYQGRLVSMGMAFPRNFEGQADVRSGAVDENWKHLMRSSC